MNDRIWSGKSQNISYSNWLREEALDSKTTLKKNTVKLLRVLQVLDSLICPEEITSVKFARVSTAMVHLITEIHLLVISTEEK